MTLFDVHPYPWEVKYRPLSPHWHQCSNPCVIDSRGIVVAAPTQNEVHPGLYDPAAVTFCEEVVRHFNNLFENLHSVS